MRAAVQVRARPSVVFETMTPSTLLARTSAAMSASSASPRSGAILRNTGTLRPASACFVACRHDAGKQFGQRLALLHAAQAGRVGRRDVDGQVGRDIGEAPNAGLIVGDAVGAVLVGADVDPDDAAAAGARSTGAGGSASCPSLLKPSRLITAWSAVEPENARLRISRLRQRRHRSDLGEAEAEPEQCVRHLGVLVVARRHAERVGKVEPGDADARAARRASVSDKAAGRSSARRSTGRAPSPDRRRTAPDGRSDSSRLHPASIAGKTWRPSVPSGSGFAHLTADSGSGP